MLVDTVPFSLITTTDVDVPRAPLAAASVNPSAPAPFRKFRRLRPARYPRDGLFIAPTRLFIDSFYIFRYQSLSRLPCVKNLNACDVYPLGSFARSPEHEEIGRASCKMIAMISERRGRKVSDDASNRCLPGSARDANGCRSCRGSTESSRCGRPKSRGRQVREMTARPAGSITSL